MEPEARRLLSRRKAALDEFYNEGLSILAAFAEEIEAPDPTSIVMDSRPFLPFVERFVCETPSSLIDPRWHSVCLGHFIGHFLVDELDGHWFVNEAESSRFFARYVVGGFGAINDPNALSDPFDAAHRVLHDPPPRSVENVLNEIIEDLRRC